MRRQLIKRYFLTGLLIWVPLAITAWVLSLIVNSLSLIHISGNSPVFLLS